MTKFKIKGESQEVAVRMLQSDAKKLDIPFQIAQNGKSFETDKDCLDYLQKQMIFKLITEEGNGD